MVPIKNFQDEKKCKSTQYNTLANVHLGGYDMSKNEFINKFN